jgi:hypothetical protein
MLRPWPAREEGRIRFLYGTSFAALGLLCGRKKKVERTTNFIGTLKKNLYPARQTPSYIGSWTGLCAKFGFDSKLLRRSTVSDINLHHIRVVKTKIVDSPNDKNSITRQRQWRPQNRCIRYQKKVKTPSIIHLTCQ